MAGGTGDVASLRAKYEEMLRLRLEHLADLERARSSPGATEAIEVVAPRAAMAALAERFPGALRELDELPLEEIRVRIETLAALERGPPGGEFPPWVEATAAFHRLARGALLAKRWLAGRKQISVADHQAFAQAHEGGDAEAWSHDLGRIAAPPGGRLTALVYERVALLIGLPVADVRALVFGSSRGPSPEGVPQASRATRG